MSRIEVSGFVKSVLQVSSSAPDTDFAVNLVDVARDGTAWIIPTRSSAPVIAPVSASP